MSWPHYERGRHGCLAVFGHGGAPCFNALLTLLTVALGLPARLKPMWLILAGAIAGMRGIL